MEEYNVYKIVYGLHTSAIVHTRYVVADSAKGAITLLEGSSDSLLKIMKVKLTNRRVWISGPVNL